MQEPERFRTQAYRRVVDPTESTRCCRIAATAVKAMEQAAARRYPLEACGLLLGRLDAPGWRIDEAREVPNLSTDRAADRFILDPQAYRAMDEELRGSGREIVGIFHSHPDCPARPSPTDLQGAWEGFAYVIVAVAGDGPREMHCWTLNERGDRFQAVKVIESGEEQ